MIKKLFQNLKELVNTLNSAMSARVDKLETRGTVVASDDKPGTASITIPNKSTWSYMLICAYCVVGSNTIIYQTIVSSVQNFDSNSVIVLGGYSVGSNDYGLCNVNISLSATGGSVSLRNFYYATQNKISAAHLGVRFYK